MTPRLEGHTAGTYPRPWDILRLPNWDIYGPLGSKSRTVAEQAYHAEVTASWDAYRTAILKASSPQAGEGKGV